MNIITICVLAVITVILIVAIKPKNNEIALMLGICASVIILMSVFSSVASVIDVVNKIVAVSNIGTSYVVILLKVIGICIVTEFAVNTCKDAGSQALANNVSLAGKIMVTVTALPLYNDILNTVLSIAEM